MSVSIERRRRRSSTARIVIFSLGFLLVFSQVCSVSAAETSGVSRSRWSPARKARFNGSLQHHARTSHSASDKVYEEDKRLIHTGPNPLHN